MVAQQVRHPAYGEGSIQTPVENGYVTALFAGGVRVTLPHTELELIPAFMAGDRVERGGRQGTVKAVEFGQAHIAWDNHNETYVSLADVSGFKRLPSLPAGTEVKHKYTVGSGGWTVRTPTRGDTHVLVQWNTGLTFAVKLELLAPVQPQKTQEDERTVDDALADIRTEIAKWRTVGDEAEEKIRVLTEQATVLLDAKRHSALVQSIEKW